MTRNDHSFPTMQDKSAGMWDNTGLVWEWSRTTSAPGGGVEQTVASPEASR